MDATCATSFFDRPANSGTEAISLCLRPVPGPVARAQSKTCRARRSAAHVVSASLRIPESFERQLGDRVTKRLKSLASLRLPISLGGNRIVKDIRAQLEQLLADRIMVLDGAWGVLIHRRGLSEEEYRGERFASHTHDVKGDPDLLNLTAPEIVSELHDAYFEAGADIATTNTFTATSIGQADYSLEGAAAEMSLAGARLARAAADASTQRTPDKPRFVAGSVGPLNVTLSLSPKVDDAAFRAVTFDQVRAAYEEQIGALSDGGVDLLLVETIFDTLNVKAAIVAARAVAPELPLWLSFTAIDKSGRNLSGQTSDAFWVSVEHAEPFIVGVNCSLGRPR